ncbi:MAG: hypothetical protein SFU86_20560 [Pirellulaceae bacterium]|nr:hypothetical protein [Pirellulaceae bacterium]
MAAPLRIACAAVIWWALANSAFAQQTIINVPSDALTPVGQWFTLHESVIVPASDESLYQTTNFLTYGLTETTELAATLYGVDDNGSQLSALGLGFKSTFDVLDEVAPAAEIKWTVGFMLPISLRQAEPEVGYFPYSHLTFPVPGTKFRLLAGAAAGSENLFGKESISALAGVEYPLTDHLSFTGEWFSGQHQLAGLIPGFTYHSGRLILVGGYKIPNDFDLAESGLVLEMGLFYGPGAGEEPDSSAHYGLRLP